MVMTLPRAFAIETSVAVCDEDIGVDPAANPARSSIEPPAENSVAAFATTRAQSRSIRLAAARGAAFATIQLASVQTPSIGRRPVASGAVSPAQRLQQIRFIRPSDD